MVNCHLNQYATRNICRWQCLVTGWETSLLGLGIWTWSCFIIEYMIDCVTGLQQWDSLMPAGAHVNAFVHNDKDVTCGMKLGVKIL